MQGDPEHCGMEDESGEGYCIQVRVSNLHSTGDVAAHVHVDRSTTLIEAFEQVTDAIAAQADAVAV